jgi:hypothetical protein
MRRSTRNRSLSAVGIVFLAWAGCGDSLPAIPTVKDVQQAVANKVEAVKQTAQAAGGIELTLDQPINASGCYASWLPIAGRPTIVQVTSYNDPSGESYPSFFLRVETDETQPSALPNRTLSGEALVMVGAEGPLWHTTPDRPIEFVLTEVGDSNFRATVRGLMVNSETGAQQEVSGKLEGSWQTAR